MRKRRERITKGFAAVDDRTVWTLELNRDELMIILNGIKNHRIKGARMNTKAPNGRIRKAGFHQFPNSPKELHDIQDVTPDHGENHGRPAYRQGI